MGGFAPRVARLLATMACSGVVACGNPAGMGGGTGADGSNAPSPASRGSGGAGSDASAGGSSPIAGDGGAPSADAAPSSARTFPDTNAIVAILADQLPSMNAAQTQFAATHFVGTQKQLLPATQALRAANPAFLVLHYHLAMWQSAPGVDFIVDGGAWGNDYPAVTTHEDWFWHDDAGQRVPSSVDGKLLMNVSVPGFQGYWASSLAEQVSEGQYDAIFLDSASPALLQGECSAADPRLAGTAARTTSFTELGNTTWIDAWQSWISGLASALSSRGIPLIPNTSAFTTSWDNTDYGLTPGIFAEGFASTSFAPADWEASTNELLSLSSADKIMILQNYLSESSDVATRLYYLGNYLLVKGRHTYLDYFASGPLEWYPEWGLDLGAPLSPPAANASSLLAAGVYRRDFANGSVFVNPSSSSVTVELGGGTFQQVVPTGGGAVDTTGSAGGSLDMSAVTSLTLGPTSAAIVLD